MGEFSLKEQRQAGRRRTGLAAVLLLVALGRVLSAGQVSTQDDLPRLVKRIQPAVITVMAYNAKGKAVSQGSGFFITPEGRFLTNYHVLAKAARAEVKTAAGQRYPVRGVVAADRDWDLVVAAIDPPREGVRTLKMTGVMPEVGERVVVVGSPLGLEQTLSDGVVSAVRQVSGGKFLQISAPVSPGSSGSPVINMKGEVVGITNMQAIKGQNLNFAVPGGRALALQQKAAAVQTAPTPLAALDHKKPASAQWYLDEGNRHARARQTDKAAAAYRQAIRLQPNLAEAHYGLGVAFLAQGQRTSALKEYQILRKLNPNLAKKLYSRIYR